MPSANVRLQPETRGKSPRSSWSDQEIKRIAARFGVSREAMLLRLVELSLTSLSFYRAKRKEYAIQYQIPPDDDEKTGAPPQHILAKKYNGTLYTRIVLSSLHRGGITLIEASGHLNLRPKHIEALEFEVFR
jgi:Zn-dependent peptidase ImmA (M78 family)